MTTYTAIPNTDIDRDSPITEPLMTLLRDNPIAISEGATGAPRILSPALDLTQTGIVSATDNGVTLTTGTSATVRSLATTGSGIALITGVVEATTNSGNNGNSITATITANRGYPTALAKVSAGGTSQSEFASFAFFVTFDSNLTIEVYMAAAGGFSSAYAKCHAQIVLMGRQ